MGRTHTTHEADCSGSTRRYFRPLLLLAVTGLLVACGGGGVQPVGGSGGSPGSSIALAWDAPTTPVSGYRIYYGTAPGIYLQPPGQGVNVGNATTYTATGLSSATTYYFAATSYDTSNTESIFSNELRVTP